MRAFGRTADQTLRTTRPSYGLPAKKSPGLWQRLTDLVTTVAWSKPRKGKGTFRPQRGREYPRARLIERGIVHPTPDLDAFHRGLVDGVHARFFYGTLDLSPMPVLDEAEVMAERVRTLLGWQGADRIPGGPRRAPRG